MTTSSRRTMLKGAAWSAPIIAVTAATPFAVASGCAHLNEFSSWVVTRTGGSFDASTGPVGWLPGTPATFIIMSDNNSSSSTATLTLTAEISTIAGSTYEFVFRIQSNYGYPNGSSNWMRIEVLAGSQSLYKGTTREPSAEWPQIYRTAWPIDPVPYEDHTVSFVAGTTGLTTLTYRVTVSPRLNADAANDDIRVSVPSLATCS